jgi:hypothetical protein
MANTIKIRRGNKTSMPSGGTVEGELRYTKDTKGLFIDDGTNNVLIGGPEAFEQLAETIEEAVSPENYVIDSNDKVVTTSTNGLRTHLSLNYNGTSGKLQILGKPDSSSDPILVTEVNLPVDKYLKSAEIVKVEVDPDLDPQQDPPQDPAPGTYLLLTFNTADGENEVYIDLATLIDVYTSGDNAIDVTDNAISLVIDANSHIEIGDDGLAFEEGYELLTSTLKSSITAHINDTSSNPHNITKNTLGLGNVDNTADNVKTIDGGTWT